jgi:hypothetical protein
MAEPSLQLGNGNWAGKSGNLLAYHKANNNFYADDLTFARASTGTIVNSDGLIEQVPYNLATYSEQFDNAAWSKTGVTVTANSITSPSGDMNADTLAFGTSGNEIVQSVSGLTVGQDYTLSIYLKVASGTTTMSFGNISYVTPSITVTSEWQRFTVTQSAASATRYPKLVCTESVNVYAYGAQLNSGSTAKTYYPTTTRLNIPRVDYLNNANGSLLLEGQRTNLITYSEDFSDSSWAKNFLSLTSNTTTSPDGATNGSKLTITSSPANLSSVLSLTNGIEYTISCFVKKGTNRWVRLANNSSASTGAWFDLDNNVVGTVNSTSASITDYGSGWFRISNTFNAIGSDIFVALSDNNGGTASTLTGNTVFVYGFQAEQGSYPTSIIPTSGTTVTRLADTSSTTGLSDVIGQTEGTVYWEVDVETTVATANENILNIDNGSFGNTIYFIKSATGNLIGEMYASAVVQASFTKTSITKGVHKMAMGYANNNTALFIDGVQVGVTDTSCTIPSTSRLELGAGALGASDGKIKSLQLYKTRLSNTELATLTTI